MTSLSDKSPRTATSSAASSIIAPPIFGHSGGDTLICFSHLRWKFVFQRPQHLMTRFAQSKRVLVWEEPLGADEGAAASVTATQDGGVTVLTPRLPEGLAHEEAIAALAGLLDAALAERRVEKPIVWYYTPMMLEFSRPVAERAAGRSCTTVWTNSPPSSSHPSGCGDWNATWSARDVVFTGGYSLYEAKRGWHANTHPFPSSVDRAHFGRARTLTEADAPADQAALPQPRLGFYGVIDERMDLKLLTRTGRRALRMVRRHGRPSGEDRSGQPAQARQHHYLGAKSYDELPAYLPDGTWRFVPSPSMTPPASSARPRRRSISPGASRWSQPASWTCAATTASWRPSASPTPMRSSSRVRDHASARQGHGLHLARGGGRGAVGPVVGQQLPPAWPRWWTKRSCAIRKGRLR